MKSLEERILHLEKFLSKRFGKAFDEYDPEDYKLKSPTGTPKHHYRMRDVKENKGRLTMYYDENGEMKMKRVFDE